MLRPLLTGLIDRPGDENDGAEIVDVVLRGAHTELCGRSVLEEAVFKAARLFARALAAISWLALFSNTRVAHAACPRVGFTWVEPHASAGTRPVKIGKNKVIYVQRVPITTTSDIVDIKLARESADRSDADLLIKFTPAADKRLHDATTNRSGHWLAFVLNDEVLVDSQWVGSYGFDPGEKRVSMKHGMKRARKLMKALRGCIGTRADGRGH